MAPNRRPPVEIVGIACKTSPQRINISIIAQLEHKFDDGYDITDDIVPFNDAVELEGKQYVEKNILSDRPPVEGVTVSDGQPEEEAPWYIPDLPPQHLPTLPPPLQVHIPI